MKSVLHHIGNEQFIKDNSGNIEFVVMPYVEYNELLDMLDDYGLGLAIKKAEGQKVMSREDALKLLDDRD